MYMSPSPFPPKKATAIEPTLLDNPFAPEILATGFAGFANIGGIVQLTFDSLRGDHSKAVPTMDRVVVGRLAMPIAIAQALVTALNAFLEQQGQSPSKAMAGEALFQ